MKKKFKDILETIIPFLIIAAFISLTVIFPMVYDLSKSGELNLLGIIKYIGTIILAFIIAGYLREL